MKQGTDGTTLYLGDTEIHADPDGTQTTTRTYSYLGQPVAERIAKEGAAHTVNLLLADANDTAEVSINAGTGTLQRRHTDPFGNSRDTPVFNWQSGHGFLNAPTDDLLGTTHLGAREYDQLRGRFLSVDPVMEPMNPAQTNAYSYGWNNPNSHPDPEGTRPACLDESGSCGKYGVKVPTANGPIGATGGGACGSTCGSPGPSYDNDGDYYGGSYTASSPSAGKEKSVSLPSIAEIKDMIKYVASNPMEVLKEISGFNDLKKCFKGSWFACGMVALNIVSYAAPLAKIATAIKGIKAARDAAKAAAAANKVNSVCKVPVPNSFAADTPVRMADGTSKPIADVKLGDWILAEDPETGEGGPRQVVDLIRHGGMHTMVAVHLADGTVIDATDLHPFWLADQDRWTYAMDLRTGDLLETSDGSPIMVTAIAVSHESIMAYNLSVADLNTYFAGSASVLVHNDRGPAYDINLGDGYVARIDKFNQGGNADFEIHVARGSDRTPVGFFGSNGWFPKHGLSADVTVPDAVYNRLKGKAVEQMRLAGRLEPRGTGDITGDKWMRPRLTGAC